MNLVKNYLKYMAYMFLGIIIMYVIFRGSDPQQMITDLKKVKLTPVIISFIMGYIAYVSRGMRWIYMVKSMGYKVKLIHSINAVALAYFTNLILPRVGEITRCTALNKTHNIPVNKLMGTVIIERIIDFIMLFMIMGITLIIKFDLMIQFINTALEGKIKEEKDFTFVWILISFLGILYILFFIFRKKIRNTSIYKKIIHFLMGIKDGIKTIKNIEKKRFFIFHTLLIWLLYILMVYVVFFAIDKTSHLSFIECLFIFVVGALAMIVPVPGGIGAYHAAIMLGFMILGIDRNTGLFFATLVHTTQTFVAIIFGTVALIMISVRKKKNSSVLSD